MGRFVVELYRSRVGGDSLAVMANRVSASARELAELGSPTRHLETIFLPEDETCLCLFEAASEADVRAVALRAGISFERIVPAEHVSAAGHSPKAERI